MTTWRTDVAGLPPAEARIAAMIEAAQADYLAEYEIDMIDAGTNRDEIDRELVRYRGELVVLREKALANVRALLGGEGLH